MASPDRDPSATRPAYDRIARTYDTMMRPMEALAFGRWRKLLWSKVKGPKVLEIGVGTGANLRYYPPGVSVTAIDVSEGMLARAQEKSARQGVAVALLQMDAQALDFPDATFDSVVATCVFCSVTDPVLGLREARRVCKPGGQVLLLEHVLARNQPWRGLMRLLNSLAVRMGGENIDRETAENVRKAGLAIVREIFLFGSIVELVEATP